MTEIVARPAGGEQASPHNSVIPAQKIGFLATFIFTLSSIGLCYSGLIPFSTIAGQFPGSSLVGMMLVMLAAASLLVVVFSAIGSVVPRYGADYRLASRVVSPSLAFASSFTSVVFFSLFSGSIIASIFQDTVPVLIRILATITYNKALSNQAVVVSEPYAVTLSGTVLVILVFLLLILPPKINHHVLLVGLILSLLAWGILFFQLATADAAGFITAWERFMGEGSYFRHIADANQMGMQVDGSSQKTIMAGLLLCFGLFSGYLNPISIAAEVEEPQKNLMKGSLAALLLSFAVFSLAALLLGRLIPLEWLAGESYLLQLPEYSGLALPWLPFYAAVLYPDPLVASLTGVLWMFGILNMAHAFLYASSRVILAWVDDLILPAQVGFIHPGLKSPLIAVLLVCILAEVGILNTALDGRILSGSASFLFMAAGLILPVLGITLFPFRKKEWVQAAPRIVQIKMGRVPLISILGGVALVYLVWMTGTNFWTQFPGEMRLPAVTVFLVIFLSGLLWFFGRRYYLLSKGNDIDQVFDVLGDD